MKKMFFIIAIVAIAFTNINATYVNYAYSCNNGSVYHTSDYPPDGEFYTNEDDTYFHIHLDGLKVNYAQVASSVVIYVNDEYRYQYNLAFPPNVETSWCSTPYDQVYPVRENGALVTFSASVDVYCSATGDWGWGLASVEL
jgi:hypothetical protein